MSGVREGNYRTSRTGRVVLGERGTRPQGEYAQRLQCVRTGLVSLVFWLFVLFVLDCIIICQASARARVCRVWGEVSSW